MDLILCHTTADFDTLGAAVGVTRLRPGSRIVLTGGCHPAVRDFLALHRDEYALIERRSVNPATIRSLTVVDTQWRDRLGKAAEWLDLPQVEITVYDHHGLGEDDLEGDIPATHRQIEAVGATATLIAEFLQAQGIALAPVEATVMALGIHVDTGSLTFDHATVRDAAALTWLMQQGANQRAIAEYVEPGLSPELQDLLATALDHLQTEVLRGYTLTWVLLPVDGYIKGLSSLASQLMTVTDCDVLLLAVRYPVAEGDERLTVIGRSRSWGYADANTGVNLGDLFQLWGGGGHPKAAALTLRGDAVESVFLEILHHLRQQIPHPPTARDLMSSPVRTIRPDTTIGEARRILLRYGHSGLTVVDTDGQVLGIIARRDLDIALHHNFSHAPVKGFMTTNVHTITPNTSLPEIEALMVTYDIGRLPVLDQGQLVGIVTRTDVLRQLHQEKTIGDRRNLPESSEDWLDEIAIGGSRLGKHCPLPEGVQALLRERLSPALQQVLHRIAQQAELRGWQLYLVGGAVRDLLLSQWDRPVGLDDVDLVVDGCHGAVGDGAGVELARSLRPFYPQTRLQVHGRFQTAALLWHHDPDLDSLWIDIATARTEFYPYPAANPEVEASSIRQDLYRRDFTINALAIRLTSPRQGELLDFFGGLLDLQAKLVRVLHANSFIEDPTRIYRAVRFAVRLGFTLEAQTEAYIRHAIASGIYDRVRGAMDYTPALQTRLKQELKYILQSPYWKPALQRLEDLGALSCIHADLKLTPELWWQLRLVDRWLKRWDTEERICSWQLLLDVLMSAIPAEDRGRIATQLQLPTDSIERLQSLESLCTEVSQGLAHSDRPSQWVQLLSQYSLPTLTLFAVKLPRPQRRQIWYYVMHLASIRPPLDGNDLKAMGYKPGKLFRFILDRLLDATLDGIVRDRTEAEAFLAQHFPQT